MFFTHSFVNVSQKMFLENEMSKLYYLQELNDKKRQFIEFCFHLH